MPEALQGPSFCSGHLPGETEGKQHPGFTAFLDLGFVEGPGSVGINQIWKKKKKKNLDVTYSNIFLPSSFFQLQMRLPEVPRLCNALLTVFLVIFHPISF